MNKYHSIEDLEQYRSSDYLSQSFLKMVLANNVKKNFKESIAMILGSYVDCLLTSPDLADKLFMQDLTKRPSDTIRGFLVDTLSVLCEIDSIDNVKELETYRDVLVYTARQANYQNNWGDDAIWKSILKDGEEYWKFLIESKGRTIITSEEMRLSKTIASLAMSHPLTGKYFIDQPNVDKYYQLPLYWMYEDLPCKGLVDILIVEHETKTIYLTDIKSTGVYNIDEWIRVCRTKNYPMQMSWYKLGVERNFQDLIEQGYKIECRWIIIPMNEFSFKPWVIPCTQTLLNIGMYGYSKQVVSEIPINDEYKKIKKVKYYGGISDALTHYKLAKLNELVDYDIPYMTSGGKMSYVDIEAKFLTS
jgi:hypothetical protein